jgi:hypothetical protein
MLIVDRITQDLMFLENCAQAHEDGNTEALLLKARVIISNLGLKYSSFTTDEVPTSDNFLKLDMFNLVGSPTKSSESHETKEEKETTPFKKSKVSI